VSGATYTPGRLARFMADEMVRAWETAQVDASSAAARRQLHLLDPAIGEGALAIAAIEALADAGISCDLTITGFDICAKTLDVARAEITRRFPQVKLDLRHKDFLDFALEQDPAVPGPFDLVIANPPYVRTQALTEALSSKIFHKFGLGGRFDLYQPFLIGISRLLAENGAACVITSNRFLTIQSGASTRALLLEGFDLTHLWDLGDTKLFDAAVLPCVFTARRGSTPHGSNIPFCSIYSAVMEQPAAQPAARGPDVQSTDGAADCGAADCGAAGGSASPATTPTPFPNAIAALGHNGAVRLADGKTFQVRRGFLHVDAGAAIAAWSPQTASDDAWLATVEAQTWRRFGDMGAARVGVKTTADKVFIRKIADWAAMGAEAPELLCPLVTHHVARRWRAAAADRAILYTHEADNGKKKAVDLDDYPKAAAYLGRHRAQLEARTYVADAGRNWYEIWVPQDPSLWAAPKLAWRDITEDACFWVESSGAVINGDCYWLAPAPPEDLAPDLAETVLWLMLGVANSRLIGTYYDLRFNNKLYAGRRRFVTQYVKEFPLPDPARPESRKIAALAKTIYAGAGGSGGRTGGARHGGEAGDANGVAIGDRTMDATAPAAGDVIGADNTRAVAEAEINALVDRVFGVL